MVGIDNYILDTCISLPGASGYVVCDAHPLIDPHGLKLYLTAPLPEPLPPDPELEARYTWALRLFDGTTCQLFYASTWPTYQPQYICSDGLQMDDFPLPGTLWIASRGIFSEATCTISQPLASEIDIVWK